MTTTITPSRFGLKYAPIPTLSLEYEEDLGVIDDETGVRSLYVFKESQGESDKRPRIRKKIHVVELPQLTGASEPQEIARQLQRENQRFLGPTVVKEQQLRRLLQQLVDHLHKAEVGTTRDNNTAPSAVGKPSAVDAEDDDDGLEQSAMEEPTVEASTSLDASHTAEQPKPNETLRSTTSRFITQPDEDEEEAHAASPLAKQSASVDCDDRDDADDDAKKKKALKSEAEASADEDDVQSEELEYFSEDGSDEDSF